MKRLFVLEALIISPTAAVAVLLAASILGGAALVIVARTLFCKDEAPARRLRRLIEAIRR